MRQIYKDEIGVLLVILFCAGLAIGAYLGFDAQEEKIEKLEKDKVRLTQERDEAEFYMTVLDLKVQAMLNIWSKMIEEDNKIIYYNDEALEND